MPTILVVDDHPTNRKLIKAVLGYEFYRVLEESFGSEHESLVLSEIENKEGIYESIKKFLGKGK